MRFYYNGCGFSVGYSADDADNFSANWPGSSVEGKGGFEFDGDGDLIGRWGSADEGDGADWLAFVEDCKEYGLPRFKKREKRENAKKLQAGVCPHCGKNLA